MSNYEYQGTTLVGIPQNLQTCIIETYVTGLGEFFAQNSKTTLKKFVFLSPSSLTKLTGYAFSDLPNLQSIDFTNCSKLTEVNSHIFLNSINLRNVIFPDCLIFFDTDVFVLTSLESFKIPRNLQRTGSFSFVNLTTLRKVDFSDATSLEWIYYDCFSGCTAIEEIDLRNCVSLNRISPNAFYGCTRLTTVYLPPHVSSLQIEENGFFKLYQSL